jgi:pseudaminic acid biosynthesis-associated methylase
MPIDRPEAVRLEELWSGEFGDAYVKRNADAYDHRRAFWQDLLQRTGFTSALEVGCNVGGNLRWLVDELAEGATWGVDVNWSAIDSVRDDQPRVNAVWSPGRELPFRDRWFDLVFTMGVLIHQPDATLPVVMGEMVRCSQRFVLCGEYYAAESTEVPYHGVDGALFKRDYGRLFTEQFPNLSLVDEGFLSKDAGWDDVTWWLFERG